MNTEKEELALDLRLEGWCAHAAGMRLNECPYERRSFNALHWLKGWFEWAWVTRR